ncbi:MAG: hypothetical protein JSR34_04520 [Proteobacteria bacterium]|nr:hypothetical protein [Pseudomonadota bacterium]
MSDTSQPDPAPPSEHTGTEPTDSSSHRGTGTLRHLHWKKFFIDLVIVVLGVFIGMQASNWNQQRATNEQSAIFTARLKADLRDADWTYQFLIAYNREVLASANRTVDALDGKAPLSDEALLVNAYRATQYRHWYKHIATYTELISTGTIGLIHDPVLRDTALRLYNVPTMDNLVTEGMQSRYREAFRMSLPNDVQRTLARRCGDRYIVAGNYAGIHGNLDYPCTTGLSAQDIADSANALRSNPNLVPYLRLRIADLETRLVDLTSNNRDILKNLRAIAAEKP